MVTVCPLPLLSYRSLSHSPRSSTHTLRIKATTIAPLLTTPETLDFNSNTINLLNTTIYRHHEGFRPSHVGAGRYRSRCSSSRL